MTAFQRCFWQKKRRHMDVVFFVRVGAFYELYDVRVATTDCTLSAIRHPEGRHLVLT